MILWYIVIGLVYLLLNVLVRKIDTDDDWLLPICWWLIWPVFALCWATLLIIRGIELLRGKEIEI